MRKTTGHLWGLILTSTLVLAVPRVASAQIAPRDQGSGYVNLSLQFQGSDRFFNGAGETSTGRNLDQLILSTYGEVGLIDRWLTLTVSGDLVRRNILSDLGATTGLGDLRLGVLTEWARWGNLRLLTGLQVGLPTGDSDPSGLGDEVTDLVALTLPTGDGELDVEPTVRVSYQLSRPRYPLRHYFILSGGYWIRTEGFSDAVTYAAEVGTQVPSPGWDRVWLILRSRGVEAFDVAQAGSSASGVGIGNGVAFTLVGAEAQVRLPAGFSLGLGVDAPVRGRGILDATAFRSIVGFEF